VGLMNRSANDKEFSISVPLPVVVSNQIRDPIYDLTNQIID